MTKAVKEGKEHSSWINPNEAYEAARRRVRRTGARGTGGGDVPAGVSAVPGAGRAVRRCVNSLSQVVLKIASPGVPDFYQGSELWDLNLVDPDNRRPVDFDARRQALDRIDALLAQPAAERGGAPSRRCWSTGRTAP